MAAVYAAVKRDRWHDHYTERARVQGYPARSVFKLEEIQKRFRILKKGARVLDLGCAPGSWLRFAAGCVGPKGAVVGVDLAPLATAVPANARFVQRDALEWNAASFWEDVGPPFDVVLSDMAPSTTGSKFVDSQRSVELSRAALDISDMGLKQGGAFVCKVFQGEDFKTFSAEVGRLFDRVAHVKPKSSRKASKEIFVVALGKRQAPQRP